MSPRDEGDRSDYSAGRYFLSDDIRLILTRLEGKVDSALEIQKIRDEVFTRAHQDHGTKLQDHELRLRVQEARRYVEPKTVWTAVTVMVGIGSLFIAIINSIVNTVTK